MNPGYISLLLISITLILFASGWKEFYVRSISHSSILLFFIGWLVLGWFDVSILNVKVNLDYLWITALSLVVLLMTEGFVHKLHLLSLGLLLGSFHFLLLEILRLDPVAVRFTPELDTALYLACLSVLLQRKAMEQIACLSIGLLLGHYYDVIIHHANSFAYLGGSAFQDQWWLCLLTARTLTVICQSAYEGGKEVLRIWLKRKGGWKK